MKLNKDAQELLERYLFAVKKELNDKRREDIVAEIESYIYDLLEERYSGMAEVDEQELEVILKEMGAHRKVAAQYSPHRYLIGPRLFPLYKIVLRIMLLVVLGALTLSMVISNIVEFSGNVWKLLLEYLGTLWSGGLSVVGVITLIFAIIERTTEGKNIEEIEELQELHIDDLPELPQQEKEISRLGVSVEIILDIIGLVFFTYIQKTGGQLPYWMAPSSDMQLIPVFTPGFMQFVPFILALTGLEISRNLTLLVQVHPTSLTNWWRIAVKIADLVLLVFLMSSLPLVSLDYFQHILGSDTLVKLEPLVNTGLVIAMGLGILGSFVDILKQVVREVRNPILLT
jgi:hypothetical protein